MKTKLLSLASILAVFNLNAVEIGPTGSGIDMSGFIDIAFADQDASTTESTVVGQVELNFDFTTDGPVSASVDFDYGINALYAGEGNLEEAVVTYAFSDGFSMSAGKMLSYMGYEAFDPTNMYQFSYAYDSGNNAVQSIYDAYDVGVSADFTSDVFSLGLWSSVENDAGYEVALAYTGIENFVAKAIFSDFQHADNVFGVPNTDDSGPYKKSTYWVQYSTGSLILAAEVAQKEAEDSGAGNDVEGFLIMGNYAFNDKVALTVRYSEEEISAFDSDATINEYSKITISPSYIFTDQLAGLIEYSSYEDDVSGNTDPGDLLAAELIFTF
jgi:hypothetical protein